MSTEEPSRRCEEAMAKETANNATGPAVLLAWTGEHQPFGEPVTCDLHGGPRQAAACRRQAAARPRKSLSALCVALPQRDRPSLLAKAVPCDRQSSARLRPSTGPMVLGKDVQGLAERPRRGNLRRDTKAPPLLSYGPAFIPVLV
jgi:hypothetical protein